MTAISDRLSKPLCPSGKNGYPSLAAAAAAIRVITRDPNLRNTGKVPRRAYECPLCHQVHLTARAGKRRR